LSYSPVLFHCSFELYLAGAEAGTIASAKAFSAATSAVTAAAASPPHPVRYAVMPKSIWPLKPI